ncbi:hypothetical protein [Arthrobacter sp. YN]|uniref:hypothetical protein n=1 Tax=Arthrobacter sp. YN TaxID=2020486 RepID=UPI001E63FC22|nr:hypothetical protein [Arthrobacter sp. YN]
MTTTTQDFSVRATIYSENLEGWGALRLVPLVPAEDIDLIFEWVTQPAQSSGE